MPQCPWFQNQRCQVYEARPLLCRLFGRIQGMKCNEPDVQFTQISKGDEARQLYGYGDTEPRFLHEACHSIEEIEVLVRQEINV